MNILDIDHVAIAKVQDSLPFQASAESSQVFYEWFYFEVKDQNTNIVLIISVKDPFWVGQQNEAPVSVYFTCHVDETLIAYSYTFFDQNTDSVILNEISRFTTHKTNDLNVILPDFSGKKIIQIHLKHTIFKDKTVEKSLFLEPLQNHKKHFWQFIHSGYSATGQIKILEIEKTKFDAFIKQQKLFYDVILKNRLKKKVPVTLSFKNAHIYADHNFGYEPLYHIKESWYWWHIENQKHYEVVYHFEHAKKSFYVSSILSDNTSNAILDHTHKTQNDSIVQKLTCTNFLIRFPRTVVSKLLGKIEFRKKIESAPFYLRIKSDHTQHADYSATLEALEPQRITHWYNQILMSARKMQMIAPISNVDAIASDFPFNTICSEITKNNGKSFFFASFFLSKEVRHQAYFVYTLCRLIDDATDANPLNHLTEDPTQTQEGSKFSTQLIDFLWSNNTTPNIFFIKELKEKISFCLRKPIDTNSVLLFLSDAKKKIALLQIERKLFDDLIHGQSMDESFQQPKNFKEFYFYCYCVAGTVGILMAKIFNTPHNKDASLAAEHLGIAMQMTNILRDVKEDWTLGRVYIPKDTCDAYHLACDERLFQDACTKQTEKHAFIQTYANTTLYYYQSALTGVHYIPRIRSRFCVRVMMAVYAGILSKILKNPLNIFKKRTVVSKFEKIMILIKLLLGCHPLTAAGIKYSAHALTQELKHEKI